MVDLSSDDVRRLQQISKHLLGHAYRLQVAAAIAECSDDELYSEGVAERAQLKEARAGEQLRHFADAGMLERLEKEGRKQLYRRHASSYWLLCRKLRDETLG